VLPAGWLVFAVVLAILLTMWVMFTLTRLDRLHARVDAAQAAMDAQLVRRAAALLSVAESAESGVSPHQRGRLEIVARAALDPHEPGQREGAENAVGRAITVLVEGGAPLGPEARAELTESAARVMIARRFYNDAVRDTRTLRSRRMPRLLRLAGHRAMPHFFDIDDAVPSTADLLESVPPTVPRRIAVPPSPVPGARGDLSR
jgi:hypothetical protein